MECWLESSLEDLYRSAVDAFPNTRKRQHATHPIIIDHITWLPFVGMKTLLVKGRAKSEGKEYNTTVLFKGVAYHDEKMKGVVPLTASDEKEYYLEQLSLADTDVLARCNCLDFRFRFNYYNHLDKSLYGRKAAKYESLGIGPPANPQELPGICKHIIKLQKVLVESGILVAE